MRAMTRPRLSRGSRASPVSEARVAERLLKAGESAGADAIVRLNGDSPLMDPALVERAIRLFREAGVDVVTNVRPRSFPKGQSVEVLSMQALRTAVARMTAAEEREHVTPFIYAHPELFSIRSFQADVPRPEVQLSIDEPQDFERCAAILEMLGAPPWQAGWLACVAAYDRVVAGSRLGVAS
jgi:spore coat polysaccharide biosynthesis protein SpsF